MEPILKDSITVTSIYTDRWGRLKPSALLYFCQEISGSHCDLLGYDWDTLAKQNMFWALIRTNVEINRLPVLGQTIHLETWPMPTTRTAYPRATIAYDADGNVLFRCTSLWVLMDIQTRTMILPGKSGVEIDGILRGMEAPAPGSIHPMELAEICNRQVRFSELDRNGHMNNTHYIQWAFDLLPADFHKDHPCKTFSICYLSEAREGQDIRIKWARDEDGILHAEGTRAKVDVPGKWERVFTLRAGF